MCEFPLITDNSSFIVNGVERLVICQIHKAPGVFFNKKNKDNGTMEYLSTIIPYRGSRLEFSFSSKTRYLSIHSKKVVGIFSTAFIRNSI